MGFYETLEKETKTEQELLRNHSFIQAGLKGELALESYLAFLKQAYHHVRHTAPLMMGAGLRFSGKYEWLRPAMSEYIEEEIGHDEWILNDIAACGGDKKAIQHSKPDLPCELMVAFTYDVVQRRNPVGIFGMVFVLEGTSIKVATPAAEALQKTFGLPNEAFSYLYSHGSLDLEHFEFFKSLMNKIDNPEDQEWVVHCAKVVFGLYTEMFNRLPLGFSKKMAQVNGNNPKEIHA